MTRHFFKVMMPGFEEKLKLPPAFSAKLKEEKSKEAILKSRKGTWKMKVCRINREDLICFEHGWPQFVDDHGLNIGDFVVFEHIGNLRFNAFIFDRTACEKEFNLVEAKKEINDATTGVAKPHFNPKNTNSTFSFYCIYHLREPDKESVKSSYHSKNPHFILTMKPHHAHKNANVTIPAEFVRSNNLGDKSRVILRDHRGREWPMKLLVQKFPQFRFRISTGWHDFYVSNDLKDGDICFFDLNSKSQSTTVLMDVQIFPAPI
ncbi:hypothetical protein DH2020_013111 [Rehmannia glutinosa]|uniref:TF-B3 domain-containing protein n=1 Tax=Rehmannia glutinosa TaxID=99300 RepID=A0ABR0X1C7_REHGL